MKPEEKSAAMEHVGKVCGRLELLAESLRTLEAASAEGRASDTFINLTVLCSDAIQESFSRAGCLVDIVLGMHAGGPGK